MTIKKWIFFIFTFNLASALKVNEIFAWNNTKFEWPNDLMESNAIEKQVYIPKNNVPLGIAKWKNKVFVTIPRWKVGVASTLNYIDIGENKSPNLIPYPSWKMNYIEDMSSLMLAPDSPDLPMVSVFRVWVDPCDRLWVLDDGVNEKHNKGGQKIIRKSILIFDLKTDKLLRRYFFNDADVLNNSFFANIVVDVTSTCDSAYAYIADLAGFGLLVYKLDENISWRIKHLYFYPDPLSGTFEVGGVTTHWIDGILGLTLSNLQNDGYRTLYFHSLTSTTQFHVSTEVIQNATWAQSNDAFNDFKVTGHKGLKSHSTTSCFDEETGIIIYTQVNKNGLAIWHTNTALTPSTFETIFESEKLLEFPADIKIDNDRNIIVLSNRLPRFFYKGLDENEINIRILSIPAQTIAY